MKLRHERQLQLTFRPYVPADSGEITEETLIRISLFGVLSLFFANSTNSRCELQFLLLPENGLSQ